MAKKSPKLVATDSPIIGTFYQTPEGKIIYTYMGTQQGIGAYEDGGKPRTYSYVEMAKMKLLDKIRDFPHAKTRDCLMSMI